MARRRTTIDVMRNLDAENQRRLHEAECQQRERLRIEELAVANERAAARVAGTPAPAADIMPFLLREAEERFPGPLGALSRSQWLANVRPLCGTHPDTTTKGRGGRIARELWAKFEASNKGCCK